MATKQSTLRRREEAKERQEGRDTLSAAAQIGVLDRRLGVGCGAKKERARLQKQVEKNEE